MDHGKSQTRFTLCAVSLGIVSALAVTGLAFYLQPESKSPTSTPEKPDRPAVPAKYFRDWPEPDFALVLTAEQHGYLLPCGCSRPQVGGLERRFNLINKLTKADWKVVPVDLGDIPQVTGPANLANVQGMLKYQTSMKALKAMNYQAVGIGPYETSSSLLDLLASYRLNDASVPVLSANLKDKETNFAGLVESIKVHNVPQTSLTVGISSLMGASLVKNKKIKDPAAAFQGNGVVLPQLIKAFQQKKVNFAILLYQGTVREAAALSKDFPQFNVILCRSEESEPPGEPVKVGNSFIINVGHKGRYVGVVGVNYTGEKEQPFEMRYQLVTLSEDFMTAEGQKNPIVGLMEKYTKTLKDKNFLSKYPRSKHSHQTAIRGVDATYVGSEVCAKCHRSEYKVWKASKHSHAYDSLLTAKNPGNREHDAECIVCHTVGFQYESGFVNAAKTPQFKHVGCESCHGPGSAHIKNKYDERWHNLMNPWRNLKGEQKTLAMDKFCQKCHDIDNDVHYKFEKRWPPIKH